ncbi:MAG: FAD-binding oxidoreductase [Gemmatimonadales bacterium]
MTFSAQAVDPVRRARYSEGAGIYRIIPAAVVRPTFLAELRAAIDDARSEGWSITPRGAGSAMDGGNLGDGLMLDLTAFESGRCVVNARHRTARLSPSIPLAHLQALAGREGLRFPPDPSSGAWATLGGMVSTNASGARTVRYGSVRPWIKELTLETTAGPLTLVRGLPPDLSHPVMVKWYTTVAPLLGAHADEIRAAFPKVRKNSAGYALDQVLTSGDLIDLVIGAEGTLGVITDIVVRLDPIPAARVSLRIALRDRHDLAPILAAIRAHDPSALELLDTSFLRLVQQRVETPERPGLLGEAAALLLVDLEGNSSAEVSERLDQLVQAIAPMALDVATALEPSSIEQLWAVRHGASPMLAGLTDGRRSLQVIEDGCVPTEQLADYLDAIDSATARQRIDAVLFGHAGDGHVHVNLLPNLNDPDWRERVRAVFDEVTVAVIRLGGTTSGEHGAGRLRAGTLAALYGETVMGVFRALKTAFDPDGIWNPGVILGAAADPIQRLKVGPDAVALPDGVAEQLRAIETNATWASGRWAGPAPTT